MELVARHPDIDAIVYLGLGIQSNQARLMRDGPLLSRPRPRADRRLPRTPGRAVRAGRGRDLGRDRQADPHRDRARGRRARQPRARRRCARPDGSVTRRANRAVTALAHLWRYARVPRPRTTSIDPAPARDLRVVGLVLVAVAVVCTRRRRCATTNPRPRHRPPTDSPRRVVAAAVGAAGAVLLHRRRGAHGAAPTRSRPTSASTTRASRSTTRPHPARSSPRSRPTTRSRPRRR